MSRSVADPPAALTASGSLEQRAEALARAHRPLRRAGTRSAPLVNLGDVSRAIEHAASAFREPRLDDPIFQKAAEWFLDNYYLLPRTLRQVKSELPNEFRRHLLHVGSDELPRVFRIADALIETTSVDFDEATLLGFIQAYQRHEPLTIAELWALPMTLRFAVLGTLLRVLSPTLGSRMWRGPRRSTPRCSWAGW